MISPTRFVVLSLLCLVAATAASASTDATVFRLFLKDGSTLASFGEYTRVADRVIFSIPIGSTPDEPRLHLVTLPADQIDWARTERYAVSARAQRYAETRGEEDFERLSSDIARVLNEVAVDTDRRHALEIAESARKVLSDWPRAHFGYRQDDVREIVALLDESISNLRVAAGISQFDLALVAAPANVTLEPLLGMPSIREQLDQLFRVAALSDEVQERVALLRAAVALIDSGALSIPSREASALKRSAEGQLREEAAIDARYNALANRLMSSATRAAAQIRIAEVEGVLNRIPQEDERLGRRRPGTIQALQASVQAQLDTARHLRLIRDQWTIRRTLYADYQRSVGPLIVQLVKVQPALEAIRRLDGPPPATLITLRGRLDGGSERLGRMTTPEAISELHNMFVGAWRFAENAVNARYTAISSGTVATAWEASSAAAGALLLLSRAQQELRAGLDPPPFIRSERQARARVEPPRIR